MCYNQDGWRIRHVGAVFILITQISYLLFSFSTKHAILSPCGGDDLADHIKNGTDAELTVHAIRKGPMEGMILVDGKPQIERSDMPVLSFESILALQRFISKG